MMAELFDPQSPVLIQGITGKEGSRMARWLIQSGIHVVGGVTPGKGGQTVAGCPVWNNVSEARAQFPAVQISSLVVPPLRVREAAFEALRNGIRFLHILTEQVPVHDVMAIRRLSAQVDARVLGPSSIGYLQFPRFRVGFLGGENPFASLQEGSVGLISTSGGMVNELMMALTRTNIGIRVAMALGGDYVVGTTLEEAIDWLEKLLQVNVLALFVEPGRPLLQALLKGERTMRKPTVIFLAGEALDDLPRGVPYGHTGTILGEESFSVRETCQQLRERGICCVRSQAEFMVECERLTKAYA